MQLANPLHHGALRLRKRPPLAPARPPSEQAIAEIRAYIAIRDELLAEAEQVRTKAKIDSTVVANDYLISCLRPPRSPYEAQCLPEDEARRERERCEIVKGRIAQLRVLAGPSAPLGGSRM